MNLSSPANTLFAQSSLSRRSEIDRHADVFFGDGIGWDFTLPRTRPQHPRLFSSSRMSAGSPGRVRRRGHDTDLQDRAEHPGVTEPASARRADGRHSSMRGMPLRGYTTPNILPNWWSAPERRGERNLGGTFRRSLGSEKEKQVSCS